MDNNNIEPWPSDWPKYYNGTKEPCDAFRGPCACGAWHFQGEFVLRQGKVVQLSPSEVSYEPS